MKLAMLHNTLIDLNRISPDQLQPLYEKSKNGELFCRQCGNPVRLYIGINELPHFYHPSKAQRCDAAETESETAAANETNSQQEEESGEGFRLPKSRAIAETKTEYLPYWKSEIVKGSPAYRSKPPVSSDINDDFFKQLNEQKIVLDKQQTDAATATEGPLLVLSGAGSGKTRVLTVRTAYMLTVKKIDPRSIMLVTFTAKAANEMKHRLLTYPNITSGVLSQLVNGTFHSIFYKILIFHEPHKWQRERLIKWDWEKEKILKMAAREMSLDEKEFSFENAIAQIGLWKNSLIFPDGIQPRDDWEKSCAALYQHYEEYKENNGRYDFDDMLAGCYSFLKDNPEILEKYQQRFKYFLLDEFQDINKVQYELIKLLSKQTKNICAVGDDDQAIYSFRGSNPSFILNFEKDYPGSKVVKLTENYRSSHEIVSAANRIIKRNLHRMSKTMSAQHNDGTPAVMFYPYDEEIEATMIVTDIQEKIQNGASPGDFAILYRTHSMSRAIFERLASSTLPFVIERDAESFYERRLVRGMLAFMRLSLTPQDPKPAGEVLSSLFLKQSVLQEMKAQTILQDCDFIDSFSFVKTGHAFQEKKLKALPKKIRSLKTVSPLVALEIIEKDLGFKDFVKKRGNDGSAEKASDDIRDLRVAAKRFETLAEFIEHADHMTAMIKEVKNLSKHFTDSIQLTTIHRSKGLEYKTVYILAAVDGSLPHDFSLEEYRNGNESSLEEERRLLYVAATRAQEQLYISVPKTRRGKTAYPSRFLKALKK
ncbi:UvrD-helicase domain-containing protein [Peribacillus sp. B-H-3]|uniref:UvrD-helicase domain-containing protein n=1 Tax=Peribacillus sp. B-H-3 TaxID=3400420 RepID=UPI003B028494